MVEDTRSDMIRDYITKNPDCTKTEVIKRMEGRSAVATTHKIIHQMISDGIVLMRRDEGNSQKHHLSINDKNIFNQIMAKIDEMYQVLKLYPSTMRAASQQNLLKESDFSDLVHYVQLIIYTRISLIVRSIQGHIKSAVDRQTLYVRLVRVLAISSEPNKYIAPSLEHGVNAIMREIERKGTKLGKDKLEIFKLLHDAILCLSYDF